MKVQQDILDPNKESKPPKKEIPIHVIWKSNQFKPAWFYIKSIQADYQSNQFNSSRGWLELI
jgi:hypothetical protein